ncbi:MAG: hypothetical protein KDA79_16100 [Planctomycetaceae bacterium]|nr:hypothetical protein [Planctomycetaceae bacterium]
MAAVEINWNPEEKDLRWFAGLQILFFGVVSVLLWRRTESVALCGILVSLSLVAGVAGLIRPASVRLYYLGWMLVVFPIGWVTSHLILGVVYYFVLTPVGLILRLCGHDPMLRRADPSATSYWQKRPERTDSDRYFRQF